MKRFFVGCAPLTSIAGYIVAALLVIRDLQAAGVPNQWQDYILPVAIALFGRLAADDTTDTHTPSGPTKRPDPFQNSHE